MKIKCPYCCKALEVNLPVTCKGENMEIVECCYQATYTYGCRKKFVIKYQVEITNISISKLDFKGE